jgi:hypothetical protein
MKTELITKLGIEIPTELLEFIESGHDELSDYCHEYADGSEDVIYYAKAEELYSSASTEEREQAEETNRDCGGFPEDCDMAQRFTILAYWIINARIGETIREQAEEVEEAIRDNIQELEELADVIGDLA